MEFDPNKVRNEGGMEQFSTVEANALAQDLSKNIEEAIAALDTTPEENKRNIFEKALESVAALAAAEKSLKNF